MFESIEFMATRQTDHRTGTMASYRYDDDEPTIDIFFNTDSHKTYISAYHFGNNVMKERVLRVHH